MAVIAAAVTPTAALARCQVGVASAPYIGHVDMRAIGRAAAGLPDASGAHVPQSIGAQVPDAIKRVRVPRAIAKVLPQYRFAGYTAFRAAAQLYIVNAQGVLSYRMPLRGTGTPGNCP